MRPDDRYTTVEGEDLYRRLISGDPVYLLDVRTDSEYAEAHIPGSILLPLHEIETRLPEIPNGGTPIAVICSHGFRSISACRFLSEHGFRPLFNLQGGLDTWPGPLIHGIGSNHHPHEQIAPSRFLVDNFELLPKGLALDVAMGNGRNAIYLSTRGFDVDGVDVDPEVVTRARATARRFGAPIRAVVGNVEDGTYIIPMESYDVIVVFNFLHRPLFNDIRDGLRPGGVVVYQTYTTEQAEFGKPRDPKHLLRPGELREEFADWEILRFRETIEPATTDSPPRALSGIVARKPA